MFDVSSLVAAICEQRPKDPTFEPTDVQLSDSVIHSEKVNDEFPESVAIDPQAYPPSTSFESRFPSSMSESTSVRVKSTL